MKILKKEFLKTLSEGWNERMEKNKIKREKQLLRCAKNNAKYAELNALETQERRNLLKGRWK